MYVRIDFSYFAFHSLRYNITIEPLIHCSEPSEKIKLLYGVFRPHDTKMESEQQVRHIELPEFGNGDNTRVKETTGL